MLQSKIPWMLFKEEHRNVWYMFNGQFVNCCYVQSPETYRNNHWSGTMYNDELSVEETQALMQATVRGEGTSFTIRDRVFIIEAAGEFIAQATKEEITFRKFRPTGVAGNPSTDPQSCLFYRSEVTGPQGAHYELLREHDHTDEDVKRARNYIRKNFDPVSIKIIRERSLLKDE